MADFLVNVRDRAAQVSWEQGTALYEALHRVGDDDIKCEVCHCLEEEFKGQPAILDRIARVAFIATGNRAS